MIVKKKSYFGLGIALGAALGAAFGNLGIGIALGVVFDAVMFGRKDQVNDFKE